MENIKNIEDIDEEYIVKFKTSNSLNEKEKILKDDEEYKDDNGQKVYVSTILYGGKRVFHKVFLEDLLKILGFLKDSEIKIFVYILENTYYKNRDIEKTNIFVGTVKEIAKETKSSNSTVIKTLNKLMDTNCIVKVKSKTYRINPNLISLGHMAQQEKLMNKYNDEKKII